MANSYRIAVLVLQGKCFDELWTLHVVRRLSNERRAFGNAKQRNMFVWNPT